MNTRELIEQTVLKYPVCEYCFGKQSQITYSDKVWFICETDCERYGHSWTCPPYCGEIGDSIRKCQEYENFLLFSSVAEVENAWDKQACLKAKNRHEEMARAINEELRGTTLSYYMLSTGCTRCEVCACPKESCRHPEERIPSMESHGIVIMQLAEEMGLCYNYGGDTIVYFTMILFH